MQQSYPAEHVPNVSNVGPPSLTGIKSAATAFGNNKATYYYDPNQQFKNDTSGVAQRQERPVSKPGKEN
jgi:hypothetical protein